MKMTLRLFALLLLISGFAFAQVTIPLQPGCVVPPMVANGSPDYMSGCTGHYANSPLPKVTGGVTAISVLQGGSGYNLPTVTIDPPPAGGTQATATATVAGGVLTGITITAAGSGYTYIPAITIDDWFVQPTLTTPGTPGGGGNAVVVPVMAVTAGTGMRKFVDGLPGFCAIGVNNLGQCLPIATPDTVTFPGNDFVRIGIQEYAQRLHSDLPATKLRGYVELTSANVPVTKPAGTNQAAQYLGPIILAGQINGPVLFDVYRR